MLLHPRFEYLFVSADWFESDGQFKVITARHGNAVIESYAGTKPQLWTILPSGKIKNNGEEETYLSYDANRHVRLFTSVSPSTEWRIQEVGDFHGKVRLIPSSDRTVAVRCPYPSQYVDCEEPGIGHGSEWFLVDAKKYAVHLKSGGGLDVRMQ